MFSSMNHSYYIVLNVFEDPAQGVHTIAYHRLMGSFTTQLKYVWCVNNMCCFVIEEGFSPEHTCPNSLFGK